MSLNTSNGSFAQRSATYLGGLSAWSASVWVKSLVTGVDYGIFTTTIPAGNDVGLSMRYDAAGASGGGVNVIKFAVQTTGQPGAQFETSSNVQSTNWQHLAITWAAGSQPQFYVDGVLNVLTYASDASVTGTTVTNGPNLLIGRGVKGSDILDGWNGAISDLRFYNRKLSEAEVQTIASCVGNDNIVEGLLSRYPFLDLQPGIDLAAPRPLISNAQNTTSTTNNTTITLASYTVPGGVTNAAIIVVCGGESTSANRSEAVSCTFNGNALTRITNAEAATTVLVTTTRSGCSIFWGIVSANDTGSVVATYGGSLAQKSMTVITLSNINTSAVDTFANGIVNGNGTLNINATTNNPGTILIGGVAIGSNNTVTASGTNDTAMVTQATVSSSASGISSTTSLFQGQTYTVSFSASAPTRSAGVVVAFASIPSPPYTISDYSENNLSVVPYSTPTGNSQYGDSILKVVRRRQSS